MSFSYKRLFPSRSLRHKILSSLSWVSDERMIRLQYLIKTGRQLNLLDPKRYTEKLQWYKLNYRDPLMSECVDKIDVRSYLEKNGFGNILPKVYGTYSSAEEISFELLPRQFVIKNSLGSGNNDVIICRNKDLLDVEEVRDRVRRWLEPKRQKKHPGREWVYEREKGSRILIEEYLEPEDSESELIDYKFFFFNGKTSYMYVIADRRSGIDCQLGVFECPEFRKLDVSRVDERAIKADIQKPPNLNKMIEIGEKLAEPFPHVRVDLYDLGPKKGVRFGELTFFDGSGYFHFDPDDFDYILGAEFCLPKQRYM